MKVEVNVSQVVLQDVCVCVVEVVGFIELRSMESPGDYITCEESGNVCVCACLQVREWGRDCPFHSYVYGTMKYCTCLLSVCVCLKVYPHTLVWSYTLQLG